MEKAEKSADDRLWDLNDAIASYLEKEIPKVSHDIYHDIEIGFCEDYLKGGNWQILEIANVSSRLRELARIRCDNKYSCIEWEIVPEGNPYWRYMATVGRHTDPVIMVHIPYNNCGYELWCSRSRRRFGSFETPEEVIDDSFRYGPLNMILSRFDFWKSDVSYPINKPEYLYKKQH